MADSAAPCGRAGLRASAVSAILDRLSEILGPYRVLRRLASGGFGVVHEAEHIGLVRRVAVKVLRDDFSREHATALDRFRREALTTASLAHPHIVQVTDFAAGPPTYLVMELLKGESLRARLVRAKTLDVRDACAVVVQVLSALEVAHAAGIVHRDIKPENVFLVETPAAPIFAKVLDFGIAKLLDPHGAPLTRTNETVGSIAYMPPEQLTAGEITERTDLYSVGVLFYEMLAGKKPHAAGTRGELVAAVLRGARPEALVGVPSTLEAVVMRAMAAVPSERYASAAEMRSAVGAVLESMSDGARPDAVDPTIEAAASPSPTTTIDMATVRMPPAAPAGAALVRWPTTLRVLVVIVLLGALGAAVAFATAAWLGARRPGGYAPPANAPEITLLGSG